MFLIEFKGATYINGELVDWVEIVDGKVNFTTSCDAGVIYESKGDYARTFLNNLQAINGNISNIESHLK